MRQKVAFGVIAGAFVGLVIGVLTTTKHGRDFSRQLKAKTKNIYGNAKENMRVNKTPNSKNKSWWNR